MWDELTPDQARATVDWIVGLRWGPYPLDVVQGRHLDGALRKLRPIAEESDIRIGSNPVANTPDSALGGDK